VWLPQRPGFAWRTPGYCTAVAIHEEIIEPEPFIRSFRKPPKKPFYLDFDATDDRVYGQQLGRHFSGYYDHYILLPLFVFYGDQLLVSYLRPPHWMPATTPAPSSRCWV
jgi:hypothetical protein